MLTFLSAYGQNETSSFSSKNISLNKNKQYQQAIEKSKNELKSDPSRGDLMIIIANNYAWQEKNDSALVYIQKARQLNYYNDDLFDSWLNILLWSRQYNNLLETCKVAEQYNYTNDENLLRKQMIAYTELKAYDEGIKLAESPKNKEFIKKEDLNYLYNNLLMKKRTNVISAYYSLDCFDSYSPQHLANLGYSFPVGKNTFNFLVNYAYRFGNDDVQLESDFYLKLKKKSYMYFNYGYAFNAFLFPRHRIGYEYYMPLKNKMETSFGARYMSYANSNVFILTTHLEKYLGRSWVSFRPYYVVQKGAQSSTFLGNYRLYGLNSLNYWEIELGYGNSPDDNRYANIQDETYKNLKAYIIKLGKNFAFSRTSDIRIGIGYSREEFRSNSFRNRYLINLGYKFRF